MELNCIIWKERRIIIKMLKKVINLSKDNKGSTLVTVIVVTMFITILATMLLYMSGMNYYMKMTDMQTKENFYSAETALEEIKAGLCADLCAKAAEKAYVDTMIKYTVASSYTRYETFQNIYFDDLKETWNDLVVASGSVEDLVKSFLSQSFGSALTVSCSGTFDDSDLDTGYLYLRGVTVEYTDSKGFYTKISTDFVFTVPEMNWSVNNSYTSDGESSVESKTERTTYDISEYVNYSNWTRE